MRFGTSWTCARLIWANTQSVILYFSCSLFNSRTHELLSHVYKLCVKRGQRNCRLRNDTLREGSVFLCGFLWTKDLCEVASFFFLPLRTWSGASQKNRVVLFSWCHCVLISGLLSAVSLIKNSWLPWWAVSCSSCLWWEMGLAIG